MEKLFGTDGIRGVANTHPMTAEMALAIGRATAYVCKQHAGRHKILIGKDTRLSGYMVENALTAGICSMGVDVLLVGPLPTPGIAFTTQSMRADAGIVISASHNPFQDNGIKIFSRSGFKLSFELEKEIEGIISSGKINDIRPTAGEIGKAKRIDDALGRYIVFCKNALPESMTLDGMKIAMDCANGATYKAAPIILSELGADVIALHDRPDGLNINTRCGSQHTEDLEEAVKASGAHVGLAFDGDGDRLIAVDETGGPITGDHVLGICARWMKEHGTLANDLVIITPMANLGLRRAFDGLGIRYADAPVGDRNVLALMQESGAVLGGEQSGHIIFLDRHTTGDGIVSALQLLAVMHQTGKPLSELAAVMRVAPQELINVPVPTKPPLESLDSLQAAVRAAEEQLGSEGRVLVRYSGTELLCRVMVEGPTQAATHAIASQLANNVSEAIDGWKG